MTFLTVSKGQAKIHAAVAQIPPYCRENRIKKE
jgi:hypothetical protein